MNKNYVLYDIKHKMYLTSFALRTKDKNRALLHNTLEKALMTFDNCKNKEQIIILSTDSNVPLEFNTLSDEFYALYNLTTHKFYTSPYNDGTTDLTMVSRFKDPFIASIQASIINNKDLIVIKVKACYTFEPI